MKMNQKIKILFVEDLPTDVELARREIKKENIFFVSKVVDTEEQFRKELDEFNPDVIISDYSMPNFDGMRALKITRSLNKYIPFIVLTGSVNEETAVECMQTGANDYVLKEKIKRLPFAVLEALEKHKARLENEKMENQVRESELKYRTLIENSADAIYLLFNRKFEIINPSFEKMFGYSIDEVNRSDFDFMQLVAPESKKIIEERLEMIRSGKDVTPHYEFTAITKTGEKKEVEASVSYLDYKGVKATQGVIRDISEKKKMIEDLIAAKEKAEESDRLKSAFLSNMSHEIRTPMNGILGFTELLLEPDLSSEQKEAYINIVRQSGQRMLNTVNDIVEISKIEAGMIQLIEKETDINESVEELIRFFQPEAEKKALKLILDKLLPPEKKHISTDQNKLDSILTNLIKNAIKFTDTGIINLGCSQKGTNVEFYIKDTGIGIPAHRQEAVFNRFEQADIADTRLFQGSGLGLAISKSYVEMLGGKIWVESEEGKGSIFYFSLPLKNNMEEKSSAEKGISAQHEKEKPKVKGLKIIIAEDDESSCQFLSILIKDFAGEILEAATGIDTVELCRQNTDIDLILMDIQMPGLNGYEATKQIREFNKEVVIIAQTAYGLRGDREKSLESGCNDYIAKPINKTNLQTMIEKYFGE